MRPQVNLTEDEHAAVEAYADREGLQMAEAFGRLIRDALYLRVGVNFEWGDAGDQMIVVDTDSFSVSAPISEGVPRDRTYLVSAEYAEILDDAGLKYDYEPLLEDAVSGVTYDG